MNDTYAHVGKPLTTQITYELILEFFYGETATKQEIVRKVDEAHLERGGLKAETKVHPATNALARLKRHGQAANASLGTWEISETSRPPIENDDMKTIGAGDNSVYLYYYPTYRQFAESQGKSTWQCKIGRSDYADPVHRIYEQTGTALPEQPKIGLVIRTNHPKEMELAIHGLLEKVEDASGSEWFWASPSKVESIYKIIIQNYS